MQPEEHALHKAKNTQEAPQDSMACTTSNVLLHGLTPTKHDPDDEPKPSGEEKVCPARKKRGAKAANFKPRRKKPRDAPRRPLSAYNLFFRQERAALIARIDSGKPDADFGLNLDTAVATGKERDDPSAVFQAAARTMADRWKSMTSEDKAEYDKTAEEEMMKYRARVVEYETRMIEDARKKSAETPSAPVVGSESQPHRLDAASEGSQVSSSPAAWVPSQVSLFPPGGFPSSMFQGTRAGFPGNGNPSGGFGSGQAPGGLAAAGFLNLPPYGAPPPPGPMNPAFHPSLSPQDELLLQSLQRLRDQQNQGQLMQALEPQLTSNVFPGLRGGGAAAAHPYQHLLPPQQQQMNHLDAILFQRDQQLRQDALAPPSFQSAASGQSDIQVLTELIERERWSRMGVFPPR